MNRIADNSIANGISRLSGGGLHLHASASVERDDVPIRRCCSPDCVVGAQIKNAVEHVAAVDGSTGIRAKEITDDGDPIRANLQVDGIAAKSVDYQTFDG